MSKENVGSPSIVGFEQINRYLDNAYGIIAAKILPGEYYVTKENELITTVLGSCISACIRDKESGIGGMNHFMLPVTTSDKLKKAMKPWLVMQPAMVIMPWNI